MEIPTINEQEVGQIESSPQEETPKAPQAKKTFTCPIDPAELSQCDSCQ